MSGKKNSRKPGVFKKIIGALLVCAICGGIFVAAYIFGIEEWQEFDPAQAAQMQLCTTLYDAEGNPFQELYNTERRYYVQIETLPAYVAQAFIAIEDARFYEHSGFDLVRIGGALWADLRSGSFSQGASTITQQLIKLSYLKNEKTVTRKVAEILMAIKLEKKYSKDEILELYLNRAYFGNGAYGVETAAREYFGKTAMELTLEEAAMLAGVVNSPSRYDPRSHYEAAKGRQELVLAQMCEQGFISQEQAEEAGQISLVVKEKEEFTYQYGFYTDKVIDDAANLLTLTYTELMEGGYQIYTYLEPEQQIYLEQYSQDSEGFPAAAEDGELCQCAAVVLSAKHNGITAMIGGRTHETRLAFNRACAMRRQPGSAIKPIMVYAPAIEYLGYETTSLLMDQPEDFLGYTPRNAGDTYRGWVTLRDAVAYSINLPAVKLLNEVGVGKAKNYAGSVGIPFEEKDKNLSLALGGFTTGVSPLELAAAYMPFASGGYYDATSTVCKIVDSKGNIVYERESQAKSVLSEQTSFLMSSLLRSSVEYGTSKALAQTGIPLCAKTGTSTYDDASNNKDAWIVAYNPEYIVCCWIGFDNPDDSHYLEKGVTGGTYPAKMAAGIFSKIYGQREAPDFTVPSSIAAIEVDAYQLKENLELRPASSERESQVEYYVRERIPEALSPKASNMQVSTKKGYPLIRFSGYGKYTYALERKEVGESDFTLIARLEGGKSYHDKEAEQGKTYVYRLTPEEYYTPQYETIYLYIPS